MRESSHNFCIGYIANREICNNFLAERKINNLHSVMLHFEERVVSSICYHKWG